MYTARKTSTGSISIDGNGENFNYNLKIPGMTIDEINDLLRSYDGKDPVAYLKSKETEMYDKMADFDGDEGGEGNIGERLDGVVYSLNSVLSSLKEKQCFDRRINRVSSKEELYNKLSSTNFTVLKDKTIKCNFEVPFNNSEEGTITLNSNFVSYGSGQLLMWIGSNEYDADYEELAVEEQIKVASIADVINAFKKFI